MTILGQILEKEDNNKKDGKKVKQPVASKNQADLDAEEKKKKKKKELLRQENNRQIKQAVAEGIQEGSKRNQPKPKPPVVKDNDDDDSKAKKNDGDGDNLSDNDDGKPGDDD